MPSDDVAAAETGDPTLEELALLEEMRNAITLEDAERVVHAAKNSGLSPEEWFIQRLDEKLAERPPLLPAPARLVFATLRPAYRGRAPRRRNVRTRRAKARAPSGDPSPEPEPLDLLDAAVLVLGWERV
jgi:hypothetical protein